MNAAQKQVVAALRGTAPADGWTAAALRRAAGLEAATFQDAVRALKHSGKMQFFGLALSPSMLEQAPDPAPAVVVAGRMPLLEGNAFLHAERCLEKGRGVPLKPAAAGMLLAEIERWCAHAMVPETKVGEWLFRHPGFVALLRKRLTVREVPAAMVRAMMARWPDGMGDGDVAAARGGTLAQEAAVVRTRSIAAAPAHPIRDAIKAEACAVGENRQAARTIGRGVRTGPVDAALTGLSLADLSIGGRLQHAALGDDQIAAVQLARSQWSELWARLCDSAVAAGERPVQAMRRLIEAGLWVERLDQEDASA